MNQNSISVDFCFLCPIKSGLNLKWSLKISNGLLDYFRHRIGIQVFSANLVPPGICNSSESNQVIQLQPNRQALLPKESSTSNVKKENSN